MQLDILFSLSVQLIMLESGGVILMLTLSETSYERYTFSQDLSRIFGKSDIKDTRVEHLVG